MGSSARYRPYAVRVGPLVVALAVLTSASACARESTSDGGGPAPGADVANASAVEGVPAALRRPLDEGRLRELRQDHPVTGEGERCHRDNDCSSPLRCIDATCAFPGAMTGEVLASTPWITIDGPPIYVELATTSAQQQRGLMHRRMMLEDWGMVFAFSGDRRRSFWMENTLIPLDMLFVDRRGRVVSFIESAEPLTRTPRPSEGPARYVIELNAGQVAARGINVGDTVRFFNMPQSVATP